MCTVVILLRPGHRWPLIVGANRDEMRDRPWLVPARHWPDRAQVVAGRDVLAGGSWLGLNDAGVVAAVLNRTGSLGPAPGKRSRGELVLAALEHPSAALAARALAALDPLAYRSCNLLLGDARGAFWLRYAGDEDASGITVHALAPGVSMLTAFELDDERSARIREYLPRFRAARAPDPERNDWQQWEQLLADRGADGDGTVEHAMNVDTDAGFGTVCSALIALPATDDERAAACEPVWRFAADAPNRAPFVQVALSRG